MTEPASSTAAGVAGWKLLGGAVGLAGLGAMLASVVVMCMKRPRSGPEWAVALISTLVCSLAGGSAVVLHFGLISYAHAEHPESAYLALVGLFGLVFACGLPGWALVRWVFTWMERRADKDIAEVVSDARSAIKGGS